MKRLASTLLASLLLVFFLNLTREAQADVVSSASPNPAPIARNDSYSVNPNNTLMVNRSVGVLANDTGGPDDRLKVADPYVELSGVQAVDEPDHGTLTLEVDGSFSYTPDPGFNGSDSFTYEATNGSAISNVATVTLNIKVPANVAPVNGGLSPKAATSVLGAARLLRATYSDLNDASDIRYASLQIGAIRFGLTALYDQYQNKLYLLGDNGTTYLGGFAPGSNNVISSTQGRLNCATTVISSAGNLLVIDWSLTPLSPLAHSPNLSGSAGLPVALWVQDKAGLKDGYDKAGRWTITGNQAPENVSLFPEGEVTDVVKATRTFRATYSDPNGYSNIRSVYLQVKSGGRRVLRVAYNLHTNKLYLLKADGSGYDGGLAPGTRRTLSNTLGTLSCQLSTVRVVNATTIQVDWVITAGSSLAGRTHPVLLYVQDRGNLTSNLDQGAIWIVNSRSSQTARRAASSRTRSRNRGGISSYQRGLPGIFIP